MTDHRRTIAVDFDGVLHSYTSPWTKPWEVHDGPTPGAVEFVTHALERFDVVVFSARAGDDRGRKAIYEWLAKHLAPADSVRIFVTSTKPQAHVYLDDRGWRFEGTFPTLEEIEAFVPWNRRAGGDARPHGGP